MRNAEIYVSSSTKRAIEHVATALNVPADELAEMWLRERLDGIPAIAEHRKAVSAALKPLNEALIEKLKADKSVTVDDIP